MNASIFNWPWTHYNNIESPLSPSSRPHTPQNPSLNFWNRTDDDDSMTPNDDRLMPSKRNFVWDNNLYDTSERELERDISPTASERESPTASEREWWEREWWEREWWEREGWEREMSPKAPGKEHMISLPEWGQTKRNTSTETNSSTNMLFKCGICHKEFLRESLLSRHMTVHSEEQPYECKFCSIYCKTYVNLRDHIKKKHKELASQTCAVCGHVCFLTSDMEKHIRRKHNEKHMKCLNELT